MKNLRRIISVILLVAISISLMPIVYAKSELEGSAPGVVTTDGRYMYLPIDGYIYRENLDGTNRKIIYKQYLAGNTDKPMPRKYQDIQYNNGMLYTYQYGSIWSGSAINLSDLSVESWDDKSVFIRRSEEGQQYKGETYYRERWMIPVGYGITKKDSKGNEEAIISSSESPRAFCLYDGYLYYISGSWGHSLKRYNLKNEKTETLVENIDEVMYDPDQINIVGEWIYLHNNPKNLSGVSNIYRAKIGKWNFDELHETESDKLQIPSIENLNSGDDVYVDNNISNTVDTSYGTTSDWAEDEVIEAGNNGLIPDVLKGEDLTEKIDRAEFAAVAVLIYENISNKTAPKASSPFKDINSNPSKSDINRAYGLGITTGTSKTTFEPDTFITREQLATMLCRAIKKYKFSNWTIDTDDEYFIAGNSGKRFADHDDIEDYAKDSVYFMAKAGIIKGVDDTHFAPKATTSREEAIGYGMATREQAIIMSNRIRKAKDYIDAQ